MSDIGIWGGGGWGETPWGGEDAAVASTGGGASIRPMGFSPRVQETPDPPTFTEWLKQWQKEQAAIAKARQKPSSGSMNANGATKSAGLAMGWTKNSSSGLG